MAALAAWRKAPGLPPARVPSAYAGRLSWPENSEDAIFAPFTDNRIDGHCVTGTPPYC